MNDVFYRSIFRLQIIWKYSNHVEFKNSSTMYQSCSILSNLLMFIVNKH